MCTRPPQAEVARDIDDGRNAHLFFKNNALGASAAGGARARIRVRAPTHARVRTHARAREARADVRPTPLRARAGSDAPRTTTSGRKRRAPRTYNQAREEDAGATGRMLAACLMAFTSVYLSLIGP